MVLPILQPGSSEVARDAKLPPLEPGFIDEVKLVLRSECILTRVTKATEDTKTMSHVSATNVDRMLKESVLEALNLAFDLDAE